MIYHLQVNHMKTPFQDDSALNLVSKTSTLVVYLVPINMTSIILSYLLILCHSSILYGWEIIFSLCDMSLNLCRYYNDAR